MKKGNVTMTAPKRAAKKNWLQLTCDLPPLIMVKTGKRGAGGGGRIMGIVHPRNP